jgi:polyhydroxybutyrate depolymerase
MIHIIRKIGLIAVILIISCLVYGQTGQTPEFRLKYDGYNYRYLMHLPDGYSDNRQWPLVIVLHGTNGTPERMETTTGFTQLADEEGFIVVYPKSRDYTWNILIPNFDPSIYKNDDAGFIAALIDRLVMNYHVDRKRVYLAGLSQGGFMAFCAASQYPEKITAIGAVAGRSVNNIYSFHPLPFIYFHATDDQIVPITAYGSQWGVTIPNVDDMIAKFIQINGCTETPDIILDKNGILGRFWHAPVTNADIEYYKLTSGGHKWFNEGNDNLDATKLIWEFFATHPETSVSSITDKKKGAQGKLTVYGNKIQYVIYSQENVIITIINLHGQEMMRKTLQNQAAGSYEFTYEKKLNGGLYLITLETGHVKITKKF